MTRKLITELTEVASVADADEIALYSDEDEATRKASLATVKTFLTAGVGDTVDDAIAAITTPYTLTLLDDADAASFLTTLGITSFAQTILDDASASAALTTLGVSAFAQTLLDDATAGDALTTLGLSSFAKTLMDDADAATARTTLGLAIGTNVQAYDADLAALAGLTSAADKGIQFTGSGTAATYDLTTAGKALLDDANAAAQLTTLGVSAFVQTILDDADAAAVRATIGAAAAAGATITVKNDAGNVSTVVTTLDFLTAHFTLTESPSGEINVVIASNRVNAAAGTADRLALDNGTAWTTLAKGSNSTVLQVSSGGTLQYSTVTDAMLAGSITGGKIASLPNAAVNVSGDWTLTPVGTELIFGKECRLASVTADPTTVGGMSYDSGDGVIQARTKAGRSTTPGLWFLINSDSTAVTATGDTTFSNGTSAAFAWTAGNVIPFEISGTLVSDASVSSHTFKLKKGSTTIGQIVLAPVNSTTFTWVIKGTIYVRSTTTVYVTMHGELGTTTFGSRDHNSHDSSLGVVTVSASAEALNVVTSQSGSGDSVVLKAGRFELE